MTRVQAAVIHAAEVVSGVDRRRWACGFMIGLSSLALGTYHPALAQNGRSLEGEERSSKQPIDIPAGDLPSALTAWSRHAGLLLVYPAELISGLQTRGVRGTYTYEESLRFLLVDTGLHYHFSDAKTVTLQRMDIGQVRNSKNSELYPEEDDKVIQADPIVIEETITRSNVFLPPVDGYKADQSTSSTRSALPISETPASIGVVTRDIIRDTASRSQSDAFENVSGVSRVNSTRLGRSEQFSIRGFLANNTSGSNGVIRSNGLPVGTAFAPDAALVERYDIIKGPASIVGGAANPGGVVNRITKSPQDENFLMTDFQAGSLDLYRGVLDANGVLPQNKDVRGRMIFAVEEGGHFVDDIPVRQYTVAPSIEIDLFGGAGTLLLTGHYQKFDGASYLGIPLLANGGAPDISRTRNVGGGDRNGADFGFEGQNYELHYNHEFLNNLTLSVKGKYSESELSETALYAYAYPTAIPTSGNIYMQARRGLTDWETFAGEVFLSHEFKLLGQKHEVLFGVDHRDQQTTRLASSSYPIFEIDNIFDPANTFQAPSNTVLEAPPFIFSNRLTELKQTGVFGQVIARPIPRLTLVGAFRQDWAETRNKNKRTGVRIKGDESKFTGRAGATYELIPGLRVYAGYAQSFQVNTSSVTVDGLLIPPETGESYEVGAKLDLLDGRLRLTTALFRSYRQNVATTDLANINFSIPVGEQRHQGVEFDINGQPWPGLNLTGNFSWIDADITKDNTGLKGTTPTGIPRSYVGKVFGTYALQSGPLQGVGFGGGVYFQSGYDIDSRSMQVNKTDAYQRVDAIVFYRPPQKAYDLTINVRNLLDATYIESAGFENSFNGFGAPVSVFGTLRVKFDPNLDWSLW